MTKVQLVAATWPQQVDAAFQAYIAASQKSGLAISDARNHAEQTLTDAAGQVAESLYSALIASDTPEDQLETLWSQVAGRAVLLVDDVLTTGATMSAAAAALLVAGAASVSAYCLARVS